MVWPLAALAGAGGSIVGSAISAGVGIQVARENRAFQERMSSTAHQREIKDLKLAGLNPMLSVMGGQGASSPGGSLANIAGLQNAGSSAVSAYREGLAADQLRAQTKKTEAETAIINAGVPTADVKERVLRAFFERAEEELGNIGVIPREREKTGVRMNPTPRQHQYGRGANPAPRMKVPTRQQYEQQQYKNRHPDRKRYGPWLERN